MHISGKILVAIGIMIGIGGGILLAVGIGDLSDNEKFQYEEVTSVVAQIEDTDNVGDYGFIIYVEGLPGDSNDNGIHDYCENVIITATHDGKYINFPFTEFADEQPVDLEREVFWNWTVDNIEYISDGCSEDVVPESLEHNGTMLSRLGVACYGCMAGNTTIQSDGNVSMWISCYEAQLDGIGQTIGGVFIACCGVFFIVLGLILGFAIKSGPKVNQYAQMPVNAQMPMNNAQGVQSVAVAQPVTTTMLTEPVYENVAGVPVEPQETLSSGEKGNFWDQQEPENPF